MRLSGTGNIMEHGKAKNTEGKMVDLCVRNFYHVPELTETLLSLRSATKKNGCTYVQTPKESYIQLPDDGDRFEFLDDGRGLEELKLYLDPLPEGASLIREKEADPWWDVAVPDKVNINDFHARTGHCCEEDLRILAEDFNIDLEGELTHCEACSRVKGKRYKFRKEAVDPATK